MRVMDKTPKKFFFFLAVFVWLMSVGVVSAQELTGAVGSGLMVGVGIVAIVVIFVVVLVISRRAQEEDYADKVHVKRFRA